MGGSGAAVASPEAAGENRVTSRARQTARSGGDLSRTGLIQCKYAVLSLVMTIVLVHFLILADCATDIKKSVGCDSAREV